MAQSDSQMRAQARLIRIIHADPLVHAGLSTLLGWSSEWKVIKGEFGNERVDLILADHATAVALANTRLATAPLLVVTNQEREWHVRTALDAGVHGYVLQSGETEELLYAIRQLLKGQVYVAKVLHQKLASSCTRTALTRRETQVLQLLGEGRCNKLIARELGIGLGTVKSHVKNVMEKLGVHARTQAVVLAARHGLINPDLAESNSEATAYSKRVRLEHEVAVF